MACYTNGVRDYVAEANMQAAMDERAREIREEWPAVMSRPVDEFEKPVNSLDALRHVLHSRMVDALPEELSA